MSSLVPGEATVVAVTRGSPRAAVTLPVPADLVHREARGREDTGDRVLIGTAGASTACYSGRRVLNGYPPRRSGCAEPGLATRSVRDNNGGHHG